MLRGFSKSAIRLAIGAALVVALASAWIGVATGAAVQQPVVDKLIFDATVQPVSAGEMKEAIARAERDSARALLVQMDTPGGLVDSMREIVQAILSSKVPVIVYVSPSGARAGSAGFFILESADVAAMAPGSEAGAAHVVFEGTKPDSTEMTKVQNDARAFLRSYATRRGRNAQAADEAVNSSHSYTSEEALKANLVDVVANNDQDLLKQLNGRQITRFDGSKVTLNLAGTSIHVLSVSTRDELLGWLVNPNVALLFMVVGALLIYLEFHVPGTIVPGALGTLLVLLGIFGLNLLPIRFTAVLLLLAGLGLLVLEAKFGGHGALASAGILCLIFGAMTLVAAPIPQMDVKPAVAIALGLGFGLITVFLVRLAVRAQRQKIRIGAAAMVGSRATALEMLQPEGHVLVEGEIWKAISAKPAPKGTSLRVTGCEERMLQVEPTPGVVEAPLEDGSDGPGSKAVTVK